MPDRIDPRDQESFDRLQARLVPLWRSIEHLNDAEQTIVVVPSADVDYPLTPGMMQAYEERYLFLLLLLRQPRARMVYVTGQRIDPAIIDYYLDLMPGVIAGHARKRLFLVSPQEPTARPLTRKLLDRPLLLQRIRDLVADRNRAHLVPFATTWADRELAMRLDIPMYGADPRHLVLGTKSAGRELFTEAGVPHPTGREHLRTEDDLIEAVRDLRREHPKISRLVVKLDEGVGGVGNAVVDLRGLPDPADADTAVDVTERVRAMAFELPDLAYTTFLEKLAAQGGVVEEMVVGDEIFSPSVQMRVTPLGEIELLSTHDQLLGGPSGQRFLGSRFPANPDYGPLISRQAMAVGRLLAERGVLGRFAVDFVVARSAGEPWRSYAIELNLRKGGTTHPFLTLQFLTDGSFDAEAGEFRTPGGDRKHFVASDHVEDHALRVFTPDDLFDVAMLRRLHFDQTRLTGTVFHMMSALPELGQVGVTSVGDDPDDAEERFRETERILVEEARRAAADSPDVSR